MERFVEKLEIERSGVISVREVRDGQYHRATFMPNDPAIDDPETIDPQMAQIVKQIWDSEPFKALTVPPS